MKILEVIGEDKYVDQLDSDINSIIITMMANDVDNISMADFQEQLKGLGSVVDGSALRSYLLKNGKIKSITGDNIILDTPSNNSTFSKQNDTANQVSIQNGTLDSPDMIFTLDSGVASLINSGELTTEEAFLRGLLQFDGDVAKLIDIFSKINQ